MKVIGTKPPCLGCRHNVDVGAKCFGSVIHSQPSKAIRTPSWPSSAESTAKPARLFKKKPPSHRSPTHTAGSMENGGVGTTLMPPRIPCPAAWTSSGLGWWRSITETVKWQMYIRVLPFWLSHRCIDELVFCAVSLACSTQGSCFPN